MAVNKNRKQEIKARLAAASRKSGRKAPGTRAGTLEDWRGASGKLGKPLGRLGSTMRDGR